MLLVGSMVQIVVKKILSVLFFFVGIFKWIVGLAWRPKTNNIGELDFIHPTEVVSDRGDLGHGSPKTSWNAWEDKSFGVESKIEEYRRKQAEAAALAAARGKKGGSTSNNEPDYFAELQPTIKAPKRLNLAPADNTKSRFEFRETAYDASMTTPPELGELDFSGGGGRQNNTTTANTNAWDDAADMDDCFR